MSLCVLSIFNCTLTPRVTESQSCLYQSRCDRRTWLIVLRASLCCVVSLQKKKFQLKYEGLEIVDQITNKNKITCVVDKTFKSYSVICKSWPALIQVWITVFWLKIGQRWILIAHLNNMRCMTRLVSQNEVAVCLLSLVLSISLCATISKTW